MPIYFATYFECGRVEYWRGHKKLKITEWNSKCSMFKSTAAYMLTETFFKMNSHLYFVFWNDFHRLKIWFIQSNMYFIILYSNMLPLGYVYICNQINSSKRKTTEVKHSDKHTVVVQRGWWNEFHWSQPDSTPLENSTVFRSQEKTDLLPLLSLHRRKEKSGLKYPG